jgi:hypothetical protein
MRHFFSLFSPLGFPRNRNRKQGTRQNFGKAGEEEEIKSIVYKDELFLVGR